MKQKLHSIFNILIALVWLTNGLYSKILNQTPRHEAIVSHIFNTNYSRIIIIAIGVLEVILAIWILTKYKQRINAILQIIIVLTMNCIELILAKNLLLWGKMNIIFALMFCAIVYLNSFYLSTKNK